MVSITCLCMNVKIMMVGAAVSSEAALVAPARAIPVPIVFKASGRVFIAWLVM